jgi:hypothetical protein
MVWFHSSTLCDLDVGEHLLPAHTHGGILANPRFNRPGFPVIETYDDGIERHERDVVWLCQDKDEAATWGAAPMLKITADEVRAEVRRRGRQIRHLVYEVEPTGPVFRRLDPHSPTEAGCSEAVITAVHVIEEYDWQGFYEEGPNGEAIDPYTGAVVELDSPNAEEE